MAHIKAAIARIRLFYDSTREPLRRRVYTSLLGLLAAAVTAGLITGATAATLTGVGAIVLVVPATEYARRMVTPISDPIVDDVPGKHAPDRAPA